VSDVQEGLDDPPSRQTVYRILDELAEDDWVSSDGQFWEPDMKAELLGDVDESRDRDGFSLSADDLL